MMKLSLRIYLKIKTQGYTGSESLIRKFITDFRSEIIEGNEAVENAITYKYNNGLAGGKVNKIKVIKRIMYGRCNFKTLRNRILHIENNTQIN